MENIYEVAEKNKLKSALIILFFLVFVTIAIYILANAMGVYFGYEPGGFGLMGLALILSGLTSIGSYYFSDKIILSISGARPADKSHDFAFFTVTENIAIATGLPVPKLYVIEDTAPNAFATGRDPEHAVVCATTGLLQKLDRTELEGVIAHEMSHIRNYDIRLTAIVAVLVGTIALLADWFFRISFRRRGSDRKSSQLDLVFIVLGLVFAILSPFIAQLIQLAISRRREFMADSGAVAITRQPGGLISAIKKISDDREPLEAANKATAHLYFDNPFKSDIKGARNWFSGLFNTHPPVEERIAVLQRMT